MLRKDWEFDFSALEVRTAAEEKRDYHGARALDWEATHAEAEDAIKSKGLDIRQHSVTGGQRAQVMIDSDLADRLGEAEAKLRDHRVQREIFAGWMKVLNRVCDEYVLPLDHDDIRFFGLDRDE